MSTGLRSRDSNSTDHVRLRSHRYSNSTDHIRLTNHRNSSSTDHARITSDRDSNATIKVHYADTRFSYSSESRGHAGLRNSWDASTHSLQGDFSSLRLSTASDSTMKERYDTSLDDGFAHRQRFNMPQEEDRMALQHPNSGVPALESGNVSEDARSATSIDVGEVGLATRLKEFKAAFPVSYAKITFDHLCSLLLKTCVEILSGMPLISKHIEDRLELDMKEPGPCQEQLLWLDLISRCKLCLYASEALRELLLLPTQESQPDPFFWARCRYFWQTNNDLSKRLEIGEGRVRGLQKIHVAAQHVVNASDATKRLIMLSDWRESVFEAAQTSPSLPSTSILASNASLQLLRHGRATAMANELTPLIREEKRQPGSWVAKKYDSMPDGLRLRVQYKDKGVTLYVTREVLYRSLLQLIYVKLLEVIPAGVDRILELADENNALIDSDEALLVCFRHWWDSVATRFRHDVIFHPDNQMLLFLRNKQPVLRASQAT